MKLAVAISAAGSGQVLIKRPRDRGDSVGNKWERMNGIETFRIRAGQFRTLSACKDIVTKLRNKQNNPGAINFSSCSIRSSPFVDCQLATAVTCVYYAVRIVVCTLYHKNYFSICFLSHCSCGNSNLNS